MTGADIERMIHLLARLPGLGPRSARRAALHLIERREALLIPLAESLAQTAASIKVCATCGNFDSVDPCAICTDSERDDGLLCVVEDVASLWALERSACFRGRYHVLGGLLSALDGIGPEDLGLDKLLARASRPSVREVIFATPATVEGQTTAHYLADRLSNCDVVLSGLAQGVPMGGELDYLDDGTIGAALRARRAF